MRLRDTRNEKIVKLSDVRESRGEQDSSKNPEKREGKVVEYQDVLSHDLAFSAFEAKLANFLVHPNEWLISWDKSPDQLNEFIDEIGAAIEALKSSQFVKRHRDRVVRLHTELITAIGKCKWQIDETERDANSAAEADRAFRYGRRFSSSRTRSPTYLQTCEKVKERFMEIVHEIDELPPPLKLRQ
ncbi:MAG TPA: hypothetical protein VNM40_04270 [Candidatus Paceibacterota bacterium]|nr:hypothetical protein [Candidatus Paceibacterota bacterium]